MSQQPVASDPAQRHFKFMEKAIKNLEAEKDRVAFEIENKKNQNLKFPDNLRNNTFYINKN